MLTLSRLAVIVLTAWAVIASGASLLLQLYALPVVAALVIVTGSGGKALVLRNVPVLAFSAVFTLFVLAAGNLTGGGMREGAAMALRIVVVYNLAWAGARWLGRPGALAIILRMPSRGIRVYLLMLFSMTERLVRNSGNIVRQLSLRVPRTGRGRFILARYYFRNLVAKELTSVRYLQAAAVTRLHALPGPPAGGGAPGAVEAILLAYSSAVLYITLAGGCVP